MYTHAKHTGVAFTGSTKWTCACGLMIDREIQSRGFQSGGSRLGGLWKDRV